MKRPAGAGSMATTTTATPAEAAARVHVVVPHHQSTTTTTTTTKNSAISSLQNPRSLVAELQTVLQASRLEWTQWATHERRRCDAAVQQHAHTVSQLQSTIDATQENVLAHQLQHKLHIADSTAATTTSIPQEGTTTKNDNNDATSEHENDTNKENHPTDQDTNRSSSQDADLTDEILGLKGSLSAQKTRLQELHQEATQEEARTVESREIRSEAQASAQATLTQLRKASRPYQQFLGLDFEKAPNDQLRFLFTQLDADHPDRVVSFLLGVEEETGLYHLGDCPLLSDDTTDTLVAQLNASLDMNAFLRAMRHALVTAIPQEPAATAADPNDGPQPNHIS